MDAFLPGPRIAPEGMMRVEGIEMRDRFQQAYTFQEFLESAEPHRELWQQIANRAVVSEDILEAARSIPGQWHFLALVEDWCSDGVSSIPFLARLAEDVPGFDLRILRRDENPDLMDAHLTGGSRSIPVIMVLDDEFREVGWWGPRPASLQDLFLRELVMLSKEERARGLRAWYARDKGASMLRELLALVPVTV
jgi:hypothetical protein